MSAPSIPSKSTICELCSNLRSSQRAAGSKWPKSPGTASLETPVLAHIHPSPKLRERGFGKSSCLRSVSLEATFHFLARWLLVGLHSPASLYGYRRSYSQHKHPCGSQDTSSWRGNHGKIALPRCLGLLKVQTDKTWHLACVSAIPFQPITPSLFSKSKGRSQSQSRQAH